MKYNPQMQKLFGICIKIKNSLNECFNFNLSDEEFEDLMISIKAKEMTGRTLTRLLNLKSDGYNFLLFLIENDQMPSSLLISVISESLEKDSDKCLKVWHDWLVEEKEVPVSWSVDQVKQIKPMDFLGLGIVGRELSEKVDAINLKNEFINRNTYSNESKVKLAL